MGVRNRLRRNAYFDSVVLMRIAAAVNAREGVDEASLMMGTPANLDILAAAGLLTDEGRAAAPNDLVIAVSGTDEAVAAALDAAEEGLAPKVAADETETAALPRTIAQAVAADGDLNLALISTPGRYAAAEALKAVRLGLNVFLFSDNVAIEQEVLLKREAAARGLIVMGPDCGTAIVDGVPLGFANQVRRGPVGLVGASGTGLQQVTCLLDRAGVGISHAIGVGSHDLSEAVGAVSMLTALDALAGDAATEVVVLISKPPAPRVAAAVVERAARAGKPVVVNFIGARDLATSESVRAAATLEDAALIAAELATGTAAPSRPAADAHGLANRLAPGRHRVRGLYSGGTFAYEARLLLAETAADAEILDLGDDEYTVGRPHPMIDPTLRVQMLREALAAPDTAVVLLDVVIGYGAADDPAGALAAVLREAPPNGPIVIAFVCGTEADPQGLSRQERTLVDAGVHLTASCTAAARLAAAIAAAIPERVR